MKPLEVWRSLFCIDIIHENILEYAFFSSSTYFDRALSILAISAVILASANNAGEKEGQGSMENERGKGRFEQAADLLE